MRSVAARSQVRPNGPVLFGGLGRSFEQRAWLPGNLPIARLQSIPITWLTLEGEQTFKQLAVKWGFQPLNHKKQKCKMLPNNNHDKTDSQFLLRRKKRRNNSVPCELNTPRPGAAQNHQPTNQPTKSISHSGNQPANQSKIKSVKRLNQIANKQCSKLIKLNKQPNR